jgi:hypothetical protein
MISLPTLRLSKFARNVVDFGAFVVVIALEALINWDQLFVKPTPQFLAIFALFSVIFGVLFVANRVVLRRMKQVQDPDTLSILRFWTGLLTCFALALLLIFNGYTASNHLRAASVTVIIIASVIIGIVHAATVKNVVQTR